MLYARFGGFVTKIINRNWSKIDSGCNKHDAAGAEILDSFSALYFFNSTTPQIQQYLSFNLKFDEFIFDNLFK